jgi:hypothetical protein
MRPSTRDLFCMNSFEADKEKSEVVTKEAMLQVTGGLL